MVTPRPLSILCKSRLFLRGCGLRQHWTLPWLQDAEIWMPLQSSHFSHHVAHGQEVSVIWTWAAVESTYLCSEYKKVMPWHWVPGQLTRSQPSLQCTSGQKVLGKRIPGLPPWGNNSPVTWASALSPCVSPMNMFHSCGRWSGTTMGANFVSQFKCLSKRLGRLDPVSYLHKTPGLQGGIHSAQRQVQKHRGRHSPHGIVRTEHARVMDQGRTKLMSDTVTAHHSFVQVPCFFPDLFHVSFLLDSFPSLPSAFLHFCLFIFSLLGLASLF
jgi:hypothetical protein